MLQNGLFSAIPYIVFWAMISGGGVMADMLRTRGVRTKVVRKIMYSMGKCNLYYNNNNFLYIKAY